MLMTPDPDDFSLNNESHMDAQLYVKFFMKEREDKERTLAEGRPIYVDREYIEIRVPGKRDAQACRPATHRDKQRFPRHYEAFKKRVEMPEEGTPLAEWPQISRSQVEELAFMNVKTVEQLANMSDGNIGQFQGGQILKHRAREWLDAANATKLVAENEALLARVRDLETKLNSFLEAKQETVITKTELDSTETESSSVETESETKPVKRRSRRKVVVEG